MPTEVFGSTSRNVKNRNITLSFVQKPYLKTIYFGYYFEEYFDFKNQLENKNLPLPNDSQQATSKYLCW